MTAEGGPDPRQALEGEDISTLHWEDARHWLAVYSDLLRFKRRLLDRVTNELRDLNPEVQRAANDDLQIIETQMAGYQARLDLWFQRVWDLQGLYVDPESRVVRHQAHEVKLTDREFQMLQFLLDHPHRFFTSEQLASRAWADPALLPDGVRNYVARLRKVLLRLGVPYDLVNQPGRGYSLVFRTPS